MKQRYAGFVVGFPVSPDGRIIAIKSDEGKISFVAAQYEATGLARRDVLRIALQKIGLTTDRNAYECLSYIPPSTEDKWSSQGLEWKAYKVDIQEQDLQWLRPESEYGQTVLLSPEEILSGELHSWYRYVIERRL